MAKIYYGDENNTAVEVNVGVSQEYVDSQIEAVSANIHSIPSGGTAGQVLSKVDGDDYNVHWVEQSGGSDTDAIKKDGTTITTARIPFAQGIGIDSDNYWTERDFVSLTFGDTGGYTQIQNSNGNVAALCATKPDGSAIINGVRVEPDGLQIKANGETGTAGQVLTAQGNGTCGWADATGGFTLVGKTANFQWYKDSNNVKMCVVDQEISVPLVDGSGELQVDGPPVGCEPVRRAINVGASFNCANGKFTLVNVYIAKTFTNISIYNTTGVSTAFLEKGTVYFYQ